MAADLQAMPPDPLPKMASQVDRSSGKVARQIIEQVLLPDPNQRKSALGLLVELLEICAEQPQSWGLTLAPAKLVLNVGPAFVFQVKPSAVSLTCTPVLTGPLEQWLKEHATRNSALANGNYWFEIPIADLTKLPSELWQLCRAAARMHAGESTGRVAWWESHSPGVLSYLEEELRTDLPHPDYTRGSGRNRYWKIAPGEKAWQWEAAKAEGFIGIGWAGFGDLTSVESREDFEAKRKLLAEGNPAGYTRAGCAQLWKFRSISPGDRIIANRGLRKILGVGTVTEGYYYYPDDPRHPHRLRVRWDAFDEISVDQPSWVSTLVELGKATFAKLVASTKPVGPLKADHFRTLVDGLDRTGLRFPDELIANFLLALQCKRFVILTGISGTGKTQIALSIARHFRGSRTELLSDEVPDEAIAVTARPYMLKYRGFIVPVEVLANLELPEMGQTNSTLLQVDFPGGNAKVRLWKDPTRPTARLALTGPLGKWFQQALKVGDEFLLEAPQSSNLGPYFRFSLPKRSTKTTPLNSLEVTAVRPDWTDNRGLLGFFNPLTEQYMGTPFLDLMLRARDEEERAKAENRPPWPFFAVLDEMNLARVEQYFSDFLSGLESGEDLYLHDSQAVEEGQTEGASIPRRLSVPSNLFFVGTVNVDESTYMFSPKVLDRAFTIEFDDVDLRRMADGMLRDEQTHLWLRNLPQQLLWARSPGPQDWQELFADHRDLAEAVIAVNELLAPEHRHFGYRVANEIARYVLLAIDQAGEEAGNIALDLALLQKVLPKLHGTQQELEPILDQLFAFAVLGETPSEAEVGDLRDDTLILSLGGSHGALSPDDAGSATQEQGDDASDGSAPSKAPVYRRTAQKLSRMRRRLRQQGFTAFIE